MGRHAVAKKITPKISALLSQNSGEREGEGKEGSRREGKRKRQRD
jgi:hypothetical protein